MFIEIYHCIYCDAVVLEHQNCNRSEDYQVFCPMCNINEQEGHKHVTMERVDSYHENLAGTLANIQEYLRAVGIKL